MKGLILNVDDESLPAGSPWRTREECRRQPAMFTLDDGYPVFEVWFFRFDRWWCMSKSYDVGLVRRGVIYFDSIGQLKARIAQVQKAA